MNYIKLLINLLLPAFILSMAHAEPFTEEDIQRSFYPYKNHTPAYAGYTPGMILNQSNADKFKDILDEGLYFFVKNGWVELKTDKTTDFPLSDDYVEATRKNAANVSLNENGTLNGFVAGRAYPQEPDINDPRAGQKLVWNYQYGFNSGDSETIHPFWWTYRNAATGKVSWLLLSRLRDDKSKYKRKPKDKDL